MEKRDYFSMIGKINDSFGDNGWADGFADLPSDENEIIRQLYDKVSREDLIDYIDEYLQGYELGEFMSNHSDEIYDEDGCLKEDEYNLDTCPQYLIAKQKVLAFENK